MRFSSILARRLFAGCCVFAIILSIAGAADRPTALRRLRKVEASLVQPEEWRKIDRAVDRGLVFISKSQQPDGSFPTVIQGQPAVTSLCVMAMLARGHQPGKGPYGGQIERAIEYVLDMQDPRVGAIMSDRFIGDEAPESKQGNYNHAISGIMLGEVYGMTNDKLHERIRKAILKALQFTRAQQLRPRSTVEQGGWRYVRQHPTDSDLSVTGWQLTFLRSARNAEFNVPDQWIKEALRFVHRSYVPWIQSFTYSQQDGSITRAMAGAGIVCLEFGGEHNAEMSQGAAGYILRHSFNPYNNSERYHYAVYYCSQAMFQLGGEHWRRFFLDLLDVLSEAQHEDGSWDPEQAPDEMYGNAYTSALAILALATPYQILPIYQR